MRVLEIKNLSPTGWLDSDHIMFHACFQIFQDFIEEEKVFKHKLLEDDELKETKDLYNWWLERKKRTHPETLEEEQKDDEMFNRLMKIRKTLWI